MTKPQLLRLDSEAMLRETDNELFSILCGEIAKIRGEQDFIPTPHPKRDASENFNNCATCKGADGEDLTFLTDAPSWDDRHERMLMTA